MGDTHGEIQSHNDHWTLTRGNKVVHFLYYLIAISDTFSIQVKYKLAQTLPGILIVLGTFSFESRLLWANKTAWWWWWWIKSSSTKWKISFSTKKPFSWGARKNVCINFLLRLSLICTDPETITIAPPLQDSKECAVLISIPV